MKTIYLPLDEISIDGGTQARAEINASAVADRHVNYVIGFSDGSIKVGVTSRIANRIKELSRPLVPLVWPVRVWHTPPGPGPEAFRIEANLCRLLRNCAIPGSREWLAPIGSSTLDWRNGFKYVTQTTGMFWHLAFQNRPSNALGGAKEFPL